MIPGSLVSSLLSKVIVNSQVNPIRIAGVNQRYPGGSFGGSSTTNRRGRIPFMIGSGTLLELIPAISTRANGNAGDSVTEHPIDSFQAYIEDFENGTLTPVTKNGQTVFSLAGLTSKHMLDPISCTTLGYPNGIPKGKILWFRYDAVQASDKVMMAAYRVDQWNGASGWFWNTGSGTVSALNALGPITKSGTVFGGMGTAGGGNAIEVFGPIMMGRFKESNVVVQVSVGDSLVYGSNANIPTTGHRGYGVPSRASFEPDGVTNPIAGLIIARSGNTADDMVTPHDKTWTYFEHATHGWEDLGTNDVGAAGGSSNDSVYSTLLGRKRLIWSAMKSVGLKVATMMLLPNTTSTDDYATLTNQTATANWGVGGKVDNFRTTLLSEVAVNDNVDTCLEFNSVRWPGARWAWVGKPSNSYHWGDGSNGDVDLQGLAAVELRRFFTGESIYKLTEGFAATGGRFGYNSANPLTSGGTRFVFSVRAPIQITADVEYLDFHFDNVWFQNTTYSVNTSNRELFAYALEKFDASGYAPMLFDGAATTISIAPGEHKVGRIYPSALGLSKFTKGEKYYIRAKERVSGTGKHILSSYARQSSTAVSPAGTMFAAYYDEATESGVTIHGTGPIPAQTGQLTTGAGHVFPQAIVGKYINSDEVAIFNLGDSIDWGFGDAQTSIAQIVGPGYLDRATVDENGVADINYMNCSIPGAVTNTQALRPAVMYYMQFANILWHGHGVNDIGISGTPSLSTIYSNMEALWTSAKAQGLRIVKRGLLPVATTSGFTNKAGQTINTRFTSGSYGDQFEARMAQYVTEGKIDAYHPIRAAVSDPDPYYWLTDGTTANYVTGDAVHLNSRGSGFLAPPSRVILQNEIEDLKTILQPS